MVIDIVSDAICPWCYIGKRRLEKALSLAPQTDLQIGWRPFQLNPEMPREGIDRKEYLRAKFGDPNKTYAHVAAAGREAGIDFQFDKIQRTPNTILAHRLIRFSARQQKQDAVVEALFRAYFLEGKDIGDVETLVAVAASQGVEAAEYLVSSEDDDTIRQEDAFARQIGIQGVPCFIIDRQYAVSGAQPPEAFLEIFELAKKGESAEAPEVI